MGNVTHLLAQLSVQCSMTVEVSPLLLGLRSQAKKSTAWNQALGATGGCDGSLILAGELNKTEMDFKISGLISRLKPRTSMSP